MAVLAPSLLSADFSRLQEQVDKVKGAAGGYLHMDVMDGHFVPNISFGSPVIRSLAQEAPLPFDVHLMISEPDRYLKDFVTEKTEYITVHQEACPHLHRTVQHIKDLGVKAGVAINPATPVEALKEILFAADLILVMSVNPGFGGQSFISETLPKLAELARIRKEKGYGYVLEMDGGIGLDNAAAVSEAGCDILVAGSAVFGTENIEETVQEFMKRIG